METNDNQTNSNVPNTPVSPTPTPTPTYTYVEPKSTKILRETGTVVATVSMVAGLVTTIKNLFGKK